MNCNQSPSEHPSERDTLPLNALRLAQRELGSKFVGGVHLSEEHLREIQAVLTREPVILETSAEFKSFVEASERLLVRYLELARRRHMEIGDPDVRGGIYRELVTELRDNSRALRIDPVHLVTATLLNERPVRLLLQDARIKYLLDADPALLPRAVKCNSADPRGYLLDAAERLRRMRRG